MAAFNFEHLATEGSHLGGSELSLTHLKKNNNNNIAFQPGSPGDSQRSRRHWLQSNQPLLRMFLSYCSLHGSHGGGLASVRMELILLLQESHQVIKTCLFVHGHGCN